MNHPHDTGYKFLFSAPEMVRDLIIGFVPDACLPPILPIVLYNGNQNWTEKTDIFDLIPPVPGTVEQFKPRCKYLLIDENTYTDNELASLKNLVAAIFRFEHPMNPESISQLLALLDGWLMDRPDLKRMFAIWLRATLIQRADYRILLPEVNDLQELRTMLADRLEEWAHQYKTEGMQKGIQQGMQQGMRQGIQKGVQQGMQQGEALALQKLLTKRFGVIPPEILAKISGAETAQIDLWLDQVLDAQSMENLFGGFTTH